MTHGRVRCDDRRAVEVDRYGVVAKLARPFSTAACAEGRCRLIADLVGLRPTVFRHKALPNGRRSALAPVSSPREDAYRSWSTTMKPAGLYLIISSTHGDPAGVDDDYDWYIRHAASEQAAATSARRARAAFVAERFGAFARLLRSRSGEPTARRA